MAKKKRRTSVSLRCLIQRINRRLVAESKWLKVTRRRRDRRMLGRFHIIDMISDVVITTHVDPEAIARKLGALQTWEAVEDE